MEQILGRILRQPYAHHHSAPLLNISYVHTCSNDFQTTLDSIVVGLNKSGFSRKDYRVAEELQTQEKSEQQSEPEQMSFPPEEIQPDADDDSFGDVNPQEIKDAISFGISDENGEQSEENSGVAAMIKSATSQSEKYNAEINSISDDGIVGGELGDMLTQNTIQKQYQDEVKELRIPQFFIESSPDLFGPAYTLLEKENLSEGFSLSGLDAQISFELATGEITVLTFRLKVRLFQNTRWLQKKESEYIY